MDKDKCQGITGAFPNRNFAPLHTNIENINNGVFNYNNILNTMQNYTQLNYIVNLMTGIDVRWFRAKPELASKDVIFLEYTLYSVEPDPICIKVVVPTGQFPDAKNNFDLMGLEYEIPLEVQIDVKYWWDCAGEGTMPQKGDIVYIPLSNKLYEVNSATEVRGFMEQITAFKCNLAKYQPSASRRLEVDEETGMSLADTLSKYTQNVESVFGMEIADNIEALTSDKQFSPKLNTSINTYSKIDKGVYTTQGDLVLGGSVFANGYYVLSESKSNIAISYEYVDMFNQDDNERAYYTFINPSKKHKVFDVNNLRKISDLEYNIHYKSLQYLQVGDIINVYKTESLNLVGVISAVNSDGTYNFKIDTDTASRLIKLKATWYDIKGYKIAINSAENILYSNVIKYYLVNRKHLFIDINGTIYTTILEKTLPTNAWYGIVVNLSYKLNKLGVNIWTENELSKLDNIEYQLELLHMKAWDLNNECLNESINYSIHKSDLKLTNFRVYNTITVEPQIQISELLKRFTNNSDKCLIIDNADVITNTRYIAESR
ncbi:MAG: hypothetical protein ACRDD8_14700 [Bacteroidales bacterium]